MGDPILALDDAQLTLAGNAGPVEILRGISLTVDRGETVGLVGPSGSGKSSLLMLMGGLERASRGRILALGADMGGLDEDGLAKFRRGRMISRWIGWRASWRVAGDISALSGARGWRCWGSTR